MNAADQEKLYHALNQLAAMDGEVREFPARAKAAADYWTDAAAHTDDAAKNKSLTAAAAAVTRLIKDGKVVVKDIGMVIKTDKAISSYAGTAKQYRYKIVAKRLASAKSFDLDAQRLIANVVAMGGDPFKFNPKQDPASKVNVVKTMDHLKQFSNYYNELRVRLAKL
jgi:hypothetical protein